MATEELLEAILAELRYANKSNRELQARIEALESKDQILKPKQACEYLGITYNTLRRYRDRGYIKTVIRGGQRGYMLSELNAIK